MANTLNTDAMAFIESVRGKMDEFSFSYPKAMSVPEYTAVNMVETALRALEKAQQETYKSTNNLRRDERDEKTKEDELRAVLSIVAGGLETDRQRSDDAVEATKAEMGMRSASYPYDPIQHHQV